MAFGEPAPRGISVSEPPSSWQLRSVIIQFAFFLGEEQMKNHARRYRRATTSRLKRQPCSLSPWRVDWSNNIFATLRWAYCNLQCLLNRRAGRRRVNRRGNVCSGVNRFRGTSSWKIGRSLWSMESASGSSTSVHRNMRTYRVCKCPSAFNGQTFRLRKFH